jgi:hypothetical protein
MTIAMRFPVDDHIIERIVAAAKKSKALPMACRKYFYPKLSNDTSTPRPALLRGQQII